MEPTRGAIHAIFSGARPSEFQPLLEVRNIRKLAQDAETRYSVSVVDGDFVVKALAIPGSSLLPQLETGSIVVNTLIKATDFRVEECNGNSFLLIMKAEVMGTVPEHKRAPAERIQRYVNTRNGAQGEQPGFTQPDLGAAAAAAAAAQAGQLPGAAQAFTTPERRGTGGLAEQTPAPPGRGADGGAWPQLPVAGGQGPYGAGAVSAPANTGAAAGRGGSITDFFGRPPVSNKAAQGSFLPIAELSPYVNGRWRIKARVTTKSDVRKFTNQRGEGQLFKVDLVDQSGEICATFFGKAVDTFFPVLRPGSIYTFSRGQIKAANPRFDRGDNVLTFEEHAAIEAVDDDSSIPGVTYDFKPINQVQDKETNTVLDVQAVICAVNEPFTFTSKTTNREVVKREICLWDNSGPEGAAVMNMTIWGDRALNDNFELGAPIFVKSARVSEWNGLKELASPAAYEMNPDDPRAFALKRRFEEQQRTRPTPLPTHRAAPGGGRKAIRACREEDLVLGPPPAPGQPFDPNGPRWMHRHQVVATVTSLPPDKMPCYPSCPGLVDSLRSTQATQGGATDKRACQKKVTLDGDVWRCAAGHVCQQPVYRYLCRMQVMDHTDTLEVNVFDNVAKQFFGCDAGDYARMYESPDQDQLIATNKRVLWRRVNLRLRSQKETWQDAERVKYNVDEAQGVSLAKEARQMLGEVRASLAKEAGGLQPHA